MKTFNDCFLRFAAVLSIAVMTVAACEPEGVPGEGENDQQLAELADSLENVVYRQIRAMQLALTGEDVQIASCKPAEQEGVFDITLSTGAAFQTLVGEDVSGVLSYIEENGVKYWAVSDKKGVVSAVTDAVGKKLPVAEEVDFKVESGKYMLKSGDRSYDLGYVVTDAVHMLDCYLLADPSGVIYAVEFGFGKTVYVSGYSGVYFYLEGDVDKKSVSEMYVPKGKSATLGLAAFSGLDYAVQVSQEGWTASKREESGQTYVDVTAPAQADEETVVELKVVSADGSFVFATVNLTVSPFRSVFVSATDAVVIPSTGVQKFAYGISLFTGFDAASCQAAAEGWLKGEGTPSAGAFIASEQISRSFADILGSPLDPESRYVLWAVVDGAIMFKEFGEIAVKLEVVKPYLLDADVKVSVSGADAIFCGIMAKSETTKDEILYQISGRDSLVVAQSYLYEGKASEFTSTEGIRNELLPQTTYVLWVVPAATGAYTYTEKDIFSVEFTTNPVVDGGDLKVACGDAKVTASSINFPLSCEGASMIYYAFFDSTGGNRYSSDEVDNATKFDQMTKSYNANRIGDVHAVVGSKVDALCTGLNDVAATEYWLYAVAVDKDGKYGKVHCASAKTLALEYDASITLTVDAYDVTSKKATFKVTSEGGDLSDYIYWVGRITDPFWANSAYCGGTKNNAQKYMALNPEDENITKVMRNYGPLASDGTITIDGMTMETQYVFVILEKGEKNYSKIGYKMITTLAADLGTIVREGTPEWEAAKASVVIDWNKNQFEAAANSSMTASYGFRFSCPDNLTAYVMAASDTYFSGAGITKMEHIMIEIENYASRKYASGSTPMTPDGQLANEPDYYKDGEKRGGQLMNVYTFYVHGIPSMGFVTYFAKGSHGEGNCIYWENGHCAQYDTYVQSIARYNTLAPWEERASVFGLSGQEAADWAQALKDAYSVYYKDAKPMIYENDGKGINLFAPYAMGLNDEGKVTDRVVVMFKDLKGNYYEPMFFEVPNYFETK